MKFSYKIQKTKEIALDVPDSVYYPHEDSLLLAEVLERQELNSKQVLDMGCGCGFLAILAAARGAHVTAADINPEAIETTKMNTKANGTSIRVLISNLFENLQNEKYDLIVFNPPYLPECADEGAAGADARYSGGPTGRSVIENFINNLPAHLKPNGKVLLLISSLTGEQAVLDLFSAHGFSAKIVARKKIPWEELIVIEANQ